MITVPQRLFDLPTVRVLFRNEKSSILHKRLYAEMRGRESYVSRPALSVVLSGTQQIENQNGTVIRLQAGEMILMQKGIYTISDLVPTGGSYASLVFFFDESSIHKIFPETLTESSSKNFLKLSENSGLSLFKNSILDFAADEKKLPAVLGAAKLTELLCLLKAHQKSTAITQVLTAAPEQKRRNLSAFMEANFSKPLKVEDYAFLTGRSLTVFRRDFKNKYGQTPQTWLKARRMQRAKDLLTDNTLTVAAAAEETGYQNVSHFIKNFKSEFGVSPGVYVREVLLNR